MFRDVGRTISFSHSASTLTDLIDKGVETVDKVLLRLERSGVGIIWALPFLESKQDILEFCANADPVELLEFDKKMISGRANLDPWLIRGRSDVATG